VATVSPPEELHLLEALRAGNERAFRQLVEEYHASMLRLALGLVRNRAVAEEVVQETWLGVLNGLDRFEGRSSLKTWVFRILTNRAKTRAQREGRTVPFSALLELGDDGPSVEPERFLGPDHRWAGHWAANPGRWETAPEPHLLAGETRALIDKAIAELPPAQRTVITLRDVEGFSSEEVCNVLDISETNQRVLLHRARSKVRAALEEHVDEA
jgi:RNA polymerase sigma-70 factor, ECF subfamily